MHGSEKNGRENTLASAAIASTKHLLIATDVNGVVTLFNPASEVALGYTASEVVGRETPALWHNELEVVRRATELSKELCTPIEPGFDVFVMKAMRDGSDCKEWTFVRKDRTTFPALLTVTCIRDSDDTVSGYLGVIEDISARKQVDEELQESKAFLDLVFRSIPDLLFVKDETFRIVTANPGFLSLYPESKRNQVIGRTTLEEYDEEEAAAFLEEDRKAFADGHSETLESIVFPNGENRLLSTKKIRFEDGKKKQFILGISRDVTEREALVAKLQETNDELEEFSYRVSHDLRSPLVSSLVLLEIAREALENNDYENALQKMARTYSSLSSLERLTKDIITLARVTSSNSESLEDVSISAEVSETLAQLSSMDGYERIEFIVELSEPKFVKVKPSRFRLILSNLLSNSIKYHDPKEPAPFVRIQSVARNSKLVLRVEDNGLGVPETQQSKLFEMFQRLHAGVSFGSGLGLYMVQKSAAVLGGTVVFEQPSKKGAAFVLEIPLVQSA